MPDSPDERDERSPVRDRLHGVSVEPDFSYSWLSREPPGYEDDDADQTTAQGADLPK